MLDELGIGMGQSVPEAPQAAAEPEQKAGTVPDLHIVSEIRCMSSSLCFSMTQRI